MTKYKLTDQKMQTYRGCQWGEGITHTASGEGELCSAGWIHVYDSTELALLLNPIHGNFTDPLLWEVEVGGKEKLDHGLKAGYTSVRTVKTIPLPKAKTEHLVKFAILCALEVYSEPSFKLWADKWLNGEDRTEAAAAWEAWEAARAAAERSIDLKEIAKKALQEV